MQKKTEMSADIGRLLRPRSVAIVGASATPGALGASLLGNLERNGFAGDIHLINPKRAEINGRACLASVDQLPQGVDVAVLAIPQSAVLENVRALAARKVGAVVIFSAGFAEAGEEGLAQQHEMAEIARQHGMVIEGPNCLGCINYLDRVPLTFVEVNMAAKSNAQVTTRPSIGVVSQSGAMMTVLCTTLASRELPLSYAVSTGNEAASHAEDYVEFLLEDPHTRVIAMVVEHFRHPQRILASVRRARSLGKHVVLLHPGKSSAARESAATHTGAMAGDHSIMLTKMKRAGAMFAETLEELGDMAEIAVRCAHLPAPGVAILGESGAYKALSLDIAEDLGIVLPELNETNAPALRKAMPAFVAVSNPLDLTAQGLVEPDLYFRVLQALFEDDRCSTVIVCLIQGDPVTCGIKMPPVLRAVRELKPRKSVIVAGLDQGADVPASFIAEMRELGVPYFPSTERAFRAVKRINDFATRSFDASNALPIRLPLPAGRTVVPEYESKALLKQVGVPFSAGAFAVNVDDAVKAAKALGYPVALKAQSEQLSHKSEAGGVILGVADDEALRAAWQRVHDNVRAYDASIVLDGILIEAMGQRGLEMIIGAKTDPEWGPVILAGLGGVTAEVIKDVRLLDADLTVPEILAELDQLQSAALFHGFRGAPELDLQAVAELIARVGQVLRGTPALREIDLNPVVVYPQGKGAVALDALMLIDTATGGASS
ncbi:acetate--CoA ligase family protein [Diaphorobacter sp. HDW4B]|uniref:acetate--CoA ligase family protein n=1 Tax=Diaphorobacter sp. HDW4B TaxID=2714925 RepID=UPI00140CBD57|nr:acetate--CoA ligase family protein [Diaphorobacter sp. HDW4B]QIL70673.1 acetate--CoA ligase family protein [Diaphorobacter sp. HDW4B]